MENSDMKEQAQRLRMLQRRAAEARRRQEAAGQHREPEKLFLRPAEQPGREPDKIPEIQLEQALQEPDLPREQAEKLPEGQTGKLRKPDAGQTETVRTRRGSVKLVRAETPGGPEKATQRNWTGEFLPEKTSDWERMPGGYGSSEYSGAVPMDRKTVFDGTGLLENMQGEEAGQPAAPVPRREKRLFSWGRILLTVFFVLTAALWVTARLNSQAAEWYARTVYPKLASALSFVTGWLPVTLAELSVIAGGAGLIVWLIVWIVRLIAKQGRGRRFARGALALGFTALTVLSAFVWTGGVQYFRPTWAESAGITVKKSSADELARLYRQMLRKADAEAGRIPHPGDRLPDTGSVEEIGRQAALLMNRMAEQDPLLLDGNFSPARPVCFSRVMCYTRVTGMFFPFTGEAAINRDMPQIEYPMTICHELAHQRGVMREDEANFLAVKACLCSKDPVFRYSGLLTAITYAGNALYDEDPGLWREVSRADELTYVWKDRAEIASFWARFETPVGEVSDQINNAYLQANGQSDGVKSYGGFLDLMLSDPEVMKVLNE